MLSKLLHLTALASVAVAVDKPINPDLNAKLKTSATELTKLGLVKDDFVYDFTKHPYFTYAPGGVVNANAATFPPATDSGLTIAWLALGPCAMLPPHLHPRATNFVVAIEGKISTFMIQENGADVVTETLTPGKMTIFPKGSVHTMQNLDCNKNATLISALNSEDSGTTNLANALFALPSDMVAAALGVTGNATSFGAKVPAIGAGSALGSAECLAKCNKKVM